jgi:hypothetical protein
MRTLASNGARLRKVRDSMTPPSIVVTVEVFGQLIACGHKTLFNSRDPTIEIRGEPFPHRGIRIVQLERQTPDRTSVVAIRHLETRPIRRE